ncbi:hypothetical protein FQU23_015945 [Flavobacterium sp. XN-5]|uniref:hypothetical protein n=1 Tax=Flavobacterium sp. XN-5 TaxID=2599390 RepID=UPI0011CB417F|nr:hypothetical protein [Flavobacterium sp. XN-5]NGY38989.1 hypothetical protein [Flavobacterium sp. XN-5]
MINEKDFRTVLLILIISFVIPLIIVNEGAAIFGISNRLSQYFSYSLAVICFIATLKKPWLPKFLGIYIGGNYEGSSQRITSNLEEGREEYNKITIIQSLISVKLHGVSYDLNGNQNAIYDGYLIEGENKSFRFYVKIKTTHNERVGLIDLNFNDNPITGFGTSIETSGSTKWRFALEKKQTTT